MSEKIKLYSFWTEDGKVYEYLEDHLNLTFNIYVTFFEKRILKILASRLNRKADDTLMFIVRLAPIMHDIGKAHDSYQKNIGRIKPNFSWHEVLSAQVCWNLMEAFRYASHVPSREFETLKRMVVAAIISHHQAIRDVERTFPPKWIVLSLWELEPLYPLMLKLLNLASEEIKPNIDYDKVVRLTLNGIRDTIRICRGSLGIMRDRIFEYIGRPPKPYSILTGTIVLCDWLSAEKTRPSSYKSPMLKEAEHAFPEIMSQVSHSLCEGTED